MKLIRIGAADDGGLCCTPDVDNVGRVVSLGFFDGLHLGHRELIGRARNAAKESGLGEAVFTFADEGVKPGEPRLMSFDEKLDALGSSGIFTVFAADFDAVRSLSPEEFVRDILVGICGARIAVCGFNFRFGRNASGDASELLRLMKKYGGDAIVVEPVAVGRGAISSTTVRAALAEGDVSAAAVMLGRPYTLTSTVEHGARLGRTIDFPTLNQYFPSGLAIPRYGVYVVECRVLGREMRGVCNVGVRPTVGGDDRPRCETHLFGFSDEIYGESVSVGFLEFLRPEKTFGSIEELRAQIARDVSAAREYFERADRVN